MFNLPLSDASIRVAFILLEGFSLVPFVAASEPLRMVNRLLGREVFECGLFSESGAPVVAGNGMSVVPNRPLAGLGAFPNIIVTGGFEPRIVTPPWLRRLLRRMDASGAMIGALGTGTYHLARAGLLDGHKATVHWEYAASFAQEFPAIQVTDTLFEISPGRMTCSGGTAALDMMVHLIARQLSASLATSVADMFIHGRPRNPRDVQKVLLPVGSERIPVEVNAALSLMQQRSEGRVSVDDIASEVGVSRRHLHRLFVRHVGKTPLAFANTLRLERARRLVQQSDLAFVEIAELAGFASLASFSRSYRSAFGHTPTADRTAAG